MRKLTAMLISILLAGCASGAPAVNTASPVPQQTAAAEPEASVLPAETALPEETEIPAETGEVIEAVLEEELPMSLKVTIQDLIVTFAKDLDYRCPDELAVGDYVLITYRGEIDRNPVALAAEKVK